MHRTYEYIAANCIDEMLIVYIYAKLEFAKNIS